MKRFLILFITTLLIALNLTTQVKAEAASDINWIDGPRTVDVGDNLASLKLPKAYTFANAEDTKKIMKDMDNTVSGVEQGIVFSKDTSKNWYILFEFDKVGYVKDNDSKDLNADKLLSSMKDATEEENKKRKEKGIPELNIISWDEKPHYDTTTNNLVWSILCESSGEQFVNYNVRLLGRTGYTSVTLVADKVELKKIKPELDLIVSNFNYKDGKKYSDYVAGDEVSKLGLTALIAGGVGAASKTGIFALILVVLKKAWILVVLVIGGLFKGIKNLFTRKKNDSFDQSYMNTTYDYTKNNSNLPDDHNNFNS
ncbi:MAG: DUF2167 domain-containing protein [Clostridiaceae bacterium]